MGTPCSRASLVVGSLIAVALISPDFTASRRREPPPYSLTVTSARLRPRRSSAMVTVESLSDPKVLTPMTPPLKSAAVFTPGAVTTTKRITLLMEAISRRSPPARLACTTDDSPTRMRSRRPACKLPAPRLPPFVCMSSTLRPCAAKKPPACAIQSGSTVLTASDMPTLNGVSGCSCANAGVASADSSAALNRHRMIRTSFPPLFFQLHAPLGTAAQLEFPEQSAEAFDPIVDAAAAERVPHDRLVRAHYVDAEFALQHVERARGRPVRRWHQDGVGLGVLLHQLAAHFDGGMLRDTPNLIEGRTPAG